MITFYHTLTGHYRGGVLYVCGLRFLAVFMCGFAFLSYFFCGFAILRHFICGFAVMGKLLRSAVFGHIYVRFCGIEAFSFAVLRYQGISFALLRV